MAETPETSNWDIEEGREKTPGIAKSEVAVELSDDNTPNTSPREGMPVWRWILILLGLYLGALLYGMYLFDLMVPRIFH